MSASSVRAMTSTIALPMAATSKRAVDAMEYPVLSGKLRRALGGDTRQGKAPLDAHRAAPHPCAMTRALHALSLAPGALASPRVLPVLAQSLALTLLLFLIAGGALLLAGRSQERRGGDTGCRTCRLCC